VSELKEKNAVLAYREYDLPKFDLTLTERSYIRDIVEKVTFPKGTLVSELKNVVDCYNQRYSLFSDDFFFNDNPFYYTKINHGFWNQLVITSSAFNEDYNGFVKKCRKSIAKVGDKERACEFYSKYISSGFALDLKKLMEKNAGNKALHFGISFDNGVLPLSDQVRIIQQLELDGKVPKFRQMLALSAVLSRQFLNPFGTLYDGNVPRSIVSDECRSLSYIEYLSTKDLVVIAPQNTQQQLAGLEGVVHRVVVPPANKYAHNVYYNAKGFSDVIVSKLRDLVNASDKGLVVLAEAGVFASYLGLQLAEEELECKYFDMGLALVSLLSPGIVKGAWMSNSGRLKSTITMLGQG